MTELSRRAFVQTSAAIAAGAVLPIDAAEATEPAPLAQKLKPRAAVGSSDVIRIGVVGCGGRGTGAARDAMRGSDNVEIVALGDAFADRLASCRANLEKAASENPELGAKYRVTSERCFTGFDAYEKVLHSGIDMVILATPPGFRPKQLAAAVEAGKHIFTEKPVAVDPAGIRSVLATYEVARQKGLGIVAGTQRRHQAEYLETIRRIQDGAIGTIVGGQVYWNQEGLWHRERQPQWSDTEWQLRNWLYFTWLSGDHIVEQHVHNIDVANWVLGAHPVRAIALGGRQSRTAPAFGHIYDHFAVDYEYPNGVRILSMCRQIDGTAGKVAERFVGNRGVADPAGTIEGPNAWKFERPAERTNPYVQEHTDLVASIRAGKPLNELQQVAESTLTAIMGREAAYTGQEITWDQILNASLDLTPPSITLGPLPVPAVAMPGRTKLARGFAV
jgi:myo-inositol 2-dehydrogenase / D-chiro-inositol 1-dehydrogenase